MFTANPIPDRVQSIENPDEKYKRLTVEIKDEIRKKIEYLEQEEAST